MAREPILVVDDNPANQKLLRVLLTAEGYDVMIAKNVAEVFSVLKTFPAKMILMDLQLPGVSGLDLSRRLKQNTETQGIIIIAVTSYSLNGDRKKALAAGCDDLIAKPIDTEELPKLVSRYLRP